MKIIAIPLALGDIYDNAGAGFLKEPLDGGAARYQAIVGKIPNDSEPFIVCTAGYSPNEPRIPVPERLVSLAEQLGRFAREHEKNSAEYLFTQAICWSTRNEVRIGIKTALLCKYAHRDEDALVMISSNLSHLFRIWLYAKLYTPKNWKIKLVRAHHYFSLRSHLLEPLKIARDLVYTFRIMKRLRRIKK